jgi:precorrin-2 dehydrogenase/sirohydrochlorin ferrochelatase
MTPLYHDFTGSAVVIFGGGTVGARKARWFVDDEANVYVLSPTFSADIAETATCIRAAPGPDAVGDWIGRINPSLVVAATDNTAVNQAVCQEANERDILYNAAYTSRAQNSFLPGEQGVTVPATVEDGDVQIAISTGARSPALSKYLREQLEKTLSGTDAMAELSAELRQELREGGFSASERRDAIRAVVRSSAVWKALDTREANPREEATQVIRNTMERG